MAVGDKYDFEFTGAVQFFGVPSGVTRILIEVWGAEGGANKAGTVRGGKGGYASGELAVQGDELFRIYVGGRGGDAPNSRIDQGNSFSTAGWNGGGMGVGNGGAGGGGSDVRLAGTGDGLNTLPDARIIIGGGGGGQGSNSPGGEGGLANDLLKSKFKGRDQSDGWYGSESEYSADGGGGGGGYYGGNCKFADDAPGGSGGSSHVDPNRFANIVMTAGRRLGHGLVRFTILDEKKGRRGMNLSYLGNCGRGLYVGG